MIRKNEQIGILLYLDAEPIGWCSVAPRENFIRLSNSRILKPVDDKPVWSIVCFFIDKKYRKKGYSVELLRGVIKNLRKKGYLGTQYIWIGAISKNIKNLELCIEKDTNPEFFIKTLNPNGVSNESIR